MQKLRCHPQSIRFNRGSALVGVVVVGVIVAVVASGTMSVIGSTVNHELNALDDAKAFHAAESGLFLGTQWFSQETNWNRYKNTGFSNVFGSTGILIDSAAGIRVMVDITLSNDTIWVSSTAVKNGMGYNKIVSWGLKKRGAPAVGTYINGIPSADLGPGGGVGNNGFSNMTFDGPFHSNTSIIIASGGGPNNPDVKFVNGPTTVHNSLGRDRNTDRFDKNHMFTTGDFAEFGQSAPGASNYDMGVFIHDLDNKQGTNQSAKLDQIFTQGYKHSQDSIYISDVTYSHVTNLPHSNETATLLFRANGTARYYYNDNTGWHAIDLASNEVNDYLLVGSNDLNVLGTVKGKTTVKLTGTHEIHITGPLTYADFSRDVDASYSNYNYATANYGVPTASTNYLGLVSGHDVILDNQWVDTNRVLSAVTGTTYNGNKEMYVTATLVASNGTIRFNDVLDNGLKNDIYDRYRIIGARLMKDWKGLYWKGGAAATRDFGFYFDRRFLTNNAAPGLDGVLKIAGDNGSRFSMTQTWRERNQGI